MGGVGEGRWCGVAFVLDGGQRVRDKAQGGAG